MTALAESSASTPEPGDTRLAAVPDYPVDGDAIQLAAERTLFRRTLVGAAIGAVVCAGLWIVIVLLAVANKGYALGPVVLVGMGCGIFAGIFLGGCAGALAGATALEHAEHATLPPLP
jgi:hypothetical protein